METSIFFFIFFGQLIYVDYKCKSFTDVTTFSPRLYGIFTASVNPCLSSFLAWGLSRQVNGHAGQSACNLVSAIGSSSGKAIGVPGKRRTMPFLVCQQMRGLSKCERSSTIFIRSDSLLRHAVIGKIDTRHWRDDTEGKMNTTMRVNHGGPGYISMCQMP